MQTHIVLWDVKRIGCAPLRFIFRTFSTSLKVLTLSRLWALQGLITWAWQAGEQQGADCPPGIHCYKILQVLQLQLRPNQSPQLCTASIPGPNEWQTDRQQVCKCKRWPFLLLLTDGWQQQVTLFTCLFMFCPTRKSVCLFWVNCSLVLSCADVVWLSSENHIVHATAGSLGPWRTGLSTSDQNNACLLLLRPWWGWNNSDHSCQPGRQSPLPSASQRGISSAARACQDCAWERGS